MPHIPDNYRKLTGVICSHNPMIRKVWIRRSCVVLLSIAINQPSFDDIFPRWFEWKWNWLQLERSNAVKITWSAGLLLPSNHSSKSGHFISQQTWSSVELVFVRRSYGVKSYSIFMHSIVTKQSGKRSQSAFDMVKACNGVRRQFLYLWCSFLYVLCLKVN